MFFHLSMILEHQNLGVFNSVLQFIGKRADCLKVEKLSNHFWASLLLIFMLSSQQYIKDKKVIHTADPSTVLLRTPVWR